MSNELLGFALGLASIAICGLVSRYIHDQDAIETEQKSHAKQIRDTRTAIARLEVHTGLSAFHFTE